MRAAAKLSIGVHDAQNEWNLLRNDSHRHHTESILCQGMNLYAVL